MKSILITLFSFTCIFSNYAQSWNKLNIQQGFVDYGYNITLQNDKLYMSTNAGFCIYDIPTESYDSCYGFPGSSANTGNIYANGKIWLIRTNEVIAMDSNSAVIYDAANWLLNGRVRDHSVDTAGNLLILTSKGLSQFDGTQFVHDTTVTGFQLTVDTLNRIYLFEKMALALGGPPSLSLDTIKIKENGVWSKHAVQGITPLNNGGRAIIPDFNLRAGRLIYFDSNIEGYLTMNYPAQVDTIPLYYEPEGLTFPGIRDLEIDRDGKIWFTSIQSNYRLFTAEDSTCVPHNIYFDGALGSTEVAVFGDQVVVKIDSHLYMNSIATKATNGFSRSLEVNAIATKASAKGDLFNDESQNNPGFEMPKGSNSYGIFSAALMASVKNPLSRQFEMNRRAYFFSNAKAGPKNNSYGVEGDWIVKISQQEVQNHINNYRRPNYIMPSSIRDWPANADTSIGMATDLAPFEDINQNGRYEPQQGEYPLMKGDEALFWIHHDEFFEYHGMLYGYDRPADTAIHQTVFLEYKLINRSSFKYDSVKVGMAVDFDLGNPIDDYIACDSLSNTFFAYNGDSFDDNFGGTNGYGSNMPMVGVKFLNDTMTGFSPFNLMNGSDQEWHYLLNGLSNIGNPYYFPGSTATTKYAYTNAGGFYSEDDILPMPGMTPNPPGDRRALGHIPYFNLAVNASKTFEMAIGYAFVPNGGRLGSKDKLLKQLDSARSFWDDNITTGLEILSRVESKTKTFEIYPNPAEDRLVIQSESKGELVQFFTMTGRLVRTERLIQNRQAFNVSELEAGLYFVCMGNQVQKLVVN